MCGAPSAPSPPSEREIAVQTREKQISEERVAAGKSRGIGVRGKMQAKSDPQFKETAVDPKTRAQRQTRQTRRASRSGSGSTIATSALGLQGNGGFGSSVLTGGV